MASALSGLAQALLGGVQGTAQSLEQTGIERRQIAEQAKQQAKALEDQRALAEEDAARRAAENEAKFEQQKELERLKQTGQIALEGVKTEGEKELETQKAEQQKTLQREKLFSEEMRAQNKLDSDKTLQEKKLEQDNFYKDKQVKINEAKLNLDQAKSKVAARRALKQLEKNQKDLYTKQVNDYNAQELAKLSSQNVIRDVQWLLSDPERLYDAVGVQAALPTIPGSDKAAVEARIDTLKGKIFTQAVQQLRGLGALSDAEGKRLVQATQSLDLRMPNEEFVKALNALGQDMQAAIDRQQEISIAKPTPPTPLTEEQIDAQVQSLFPGIEPVGGDQSQDAEDDAQGEDNALRSIWS